MDGFRSSLFNRSICVAVALFHFPGYNMESVYNMHGNIMPNHPDQDGQPRMNHMMAPNLGYPHHPVQQNMMPGGLYVPQQQQLPMNDYGYHQQTNYVRPAAIPIKPPPGTFIDMILFGTQNAKMKFISLRKRTFVYPGI